MLKEIYSAIPSFPSDKFVTSNILNQTAVQTLIDPVCQNIPNIFCQNSPAECKSCGQIYCSRCIQMIIQTDSKCVKCGEYLKVKKINRYLMVIISKLSMRCHFETYGCPEAHPFENLIDHEKNCEYDSVKCPNECGKRVLKKFTKEHAEYECPKQITKCKYQYCMLKLPKEDILKHEPNCEHKEGSAVVEDHENQEEKKFEAYITAQKRSTAQDTAQQGQFQRNKGLEVNGSKVTITEPTQKNVLDSKPCRCPHPGCYYTSMENDMAEHEKNCGFKISPCKYAEKGCGYQSNKFDLMGHELKCEFGAHSKKNESSGRKLIFAHAEDFGYKANSGGSRANQIWNANTKAKVGNPGGGIGKRDEIGTNWNVLK